MDTSQPENPFTTPPEAKPDPSTLGLVGGVDAPDDVRTMAMLAHLLGAFFGILGPLIIWLIKKDEHRFIDQEGKESLNFQILVLIGYIASSILYVVIYIATCGIGFFLCLPLIVYVYQIVVSIIGATTANKGEPYRYQFNLRLVK